MHLSSEHLSISILRTGAVLAAVRLKSVPNNLVIGFQDPADFQRIPVCAGALVGPVANRISGGQITLGEKKYQMTRNEGGKTALHSGPDGIDARVWDVVAQETDEITLALSLEDGAQGLPGNRMISARYSLDGFCLWLEITATTDQPTPMNIALHPYWTLDAQSDVRQHQLQIMADHYLPVDADNLPTGTVMPTSGTDFDFTIPRPVPLTPALDVNFCLASEPAASPRPCARLTGANGLTLDIATTAPGLQAYAGAFLPEIKGVRDDGTDLAPYAGLALEPQYWPDAPNQPNFPPITLQPGEIWRQLTEYRFSPPA